MPDTHMASHEVATISVGALVREITETLRSAGVEEARNEARDIVAVTGGEGRFWPVLGANQHAGVELVGHARLAASLRARGAPFAYCVRRAAFRHLDLFVDQRVLIPRQETEQLVDLVLERTESRPGGVAVDVGTGSGAIALSLAMEGRFDHVIGTDISMGAIQVARRNLDSLPAAVRRVPEFVCCDMLYGVASGQLRAVVSNPPYIAFDEARSLPSAVRDWEPPEALLSGEGGLAATRRLVRKSADVLEEGGLLALEVDSRRASLVAEMVMTSERYRDVQVEPDLSGRERFVVALKER